MHIPHRQLSPTALRAVVEEFVTRDGTDHSSVEHRIELVLRNSMSATSSYISSQKPKPATFCP